MVAKPISVFAALSAPLKPFPEPPPALAPLPEELAPPFAANPWALFLLLVLESLPPLPSWSFELKPPPFLDELLLEPLELLLLGFFLDRPIYL